MVRTRSFGVKAGGKSSKKTASSSAAPPSSAGGSSSSKKNENGNAVQAQPTPVWQREITGFLGNPSKKPRLEDEETNNTTQAVEGEEPVEGDKTTGSNGEDDSVNGSNTTKENASSDISSKVTADSTTESEKKEKEEDKSGLAEKCSGDKANGFKTTEEGSGISIEDLPLEKDDSKEVGGNLSVSPVLVDGEKNND